MKVEQETRSEKQRNKVHEKEDKGKKAPQMKNKQASEERGKSQNEKEKGIDEEKTFLAWSCSIRRPKKETESEIFMKKTSELQDSNQTPQNQTLS